MSDVNWLTIEDAEELFWVEKSDLDALVDAGELDYKTEEVKGIRIKKLMFRQLAARFDGRDTRFKVTKSDFQTFLKEKLLNTAAAGAAGAATALVAGYKNEKPAAISHLKITLPGNLSIAAELERLRKRFAERSIGHAFMRLHGARNFMVAHRISFQQWNRFTRSIEPEVFGGREFFGDHILPILGFWGVMERFVQLVDTMEYEFDYHRFRDATIPRSGDKIESSDFYLRKGGSLQKDLMFRMETSFPP